MRIGIVFLEVKGFGSGGQERQETRKLRARDYRRRTLNRRLFHYFPQRRSGEFESKSLVQFRDNTSAESL
jgi:hypothetical protein